MIEDFARAFAFGSFLCVIVLKSPTSLNKGLKFFPSAFCATGLLLLHSVLLPTFQPRLVSSHTLAIQERPSIWPHHRHQFIRDQTSQLPSPTQSKRIITALTQSHSLQHNKQHTQQLIIRMTTLVAVSGRGRGGANRDRGNNARNQPRDTGTSSSAATTPEAEQEVYDDDTKPYVPEDIAAEFSAMTVVETVTSTSAAEGATDKNINNDGGSPAPPESEQEPPPPPSYDDLVASQQPPPPSYESIKDASNRHHDHSHDHHHHHAASPPEDQPPPSSKADKLKNLAKGYLDGDTKPNNSKKGCCPADQQKTTSDGSTSCACHSAVVHPQNGPTETGKALAAAPAISVLILGDSGVGKTSLLNRHMTGQPTIDHEPTYSIGVAQLLFPTNYGFIKVHTIDTMGESGHGKLGGLEESYFHAVQSVMIMFDVTNPKSYKNATKKWLREANSLPGGENIPKVLVGNKCDMVKERKIQVSDITFHKKKNQSYFDLSVKSLVNIEVPFLILLMSVTGIMDLNFVQAQDAEGVAPTQLPEAPKHPPGLKT